MSKKKQIDNCRAVAMTTLVPLVLSSLRIKFPDSIRLRKDHPLTTIKWGELREYGNHKCAELDPALKGCKWKSLVFHRRRLEATALPWKRHSRCHYVSFVIKVSGAKFEEHCSNISGDTLDYVLYCFIGTNYDVTTFLICIIQKRKYF